MVVVQSCCGSKVGSKEMQDLSVPLHRGFFLVWKPLEEKCFSLSRSKTEYMKCDFSSAIQEKEMLDSMVRWYLRKTSFLTCD
jgi:hypothetical protein